MIRGIIYFNIYENSTYMNSTYMKIIEIAKGKLDCEY